LKPYTWEYYLRQTRLLQLLLLCLLLTGALCGSGIATALAADETPPLPQDKLQPLMSPDSPAYRTPRAGEGFRTELFGREIKVQPDNGRSVNAFDIGAQINTPGRNNSGVVPFGAH
jgi:hypothetical protein